MTPKPVALGRRLEAIRAGEVDSEAVDEVVAAVPGARVDVAAVVAVVGRVDAVDVVAVAADSVARRILAVRD